MARRKPGDQERLRRQIMANRAQQAKMRTINYQAQPFACPNEVETETEDGGEKRACGCTLFDLKVVYTLAFVPELVYQKKGGAFGKTPQEHFMCAACGAVYGPEDWKKAMREQHEARNEKKIITPDDIAPDDNHEGEDG